MVFFSKTLYLCTLSSVRENIGQIKTKIGLTAPKIALFLLVGDRGRFGPTKLMGHRPIALPFAWFFFHAKDGFFCPLKDLKCNKIDFYRHHLVAETWNNWFEAF